MVGRGGFPEKVTALMRLESEQESTRQGPAGVRRAFQGQHVAVGERALLRIGLWGESLWPRRGVLRRSWGTSRGGWGLILEDLIIHEGALRNMHMS